MFFNFYTKLLQKIHLNTHYQRPFIFFIIAQKNTPTLSQRKGVNRKTLIYETMNVYFYGAERYARSPRDCFNVSTRCWLPLNIAVYCGSLPYKSL